jgi:hypothetical protein
MGQEKGEEWERVSNRRVRKDEERVWDRRQEMDEGRVWDRGLKRDGEGCEMGGMRWIKEGTRGGKREMMRVWRQESGG